MNRKLLSLALIMGTAGCFPGVYSKSIDGRVVDKNLKPIPNAQVQLTVFKDCGDLGGSSTRPMSTAVSKTGPDGSFRVSSTGMGGLYYLLWISCSGFSKQLAVCDDGHWVVGYTERRGQPETKTVTASGAYMFNVDSTTSGQSGRTTCAH